MLKVTWEKVTSEHVSWRIPTNLVKFNESECQLFLPIREPSGAAGLRLTLEIGTQLIKGLGTGTRGAAVISPS